MKNTGKTALERTTTTTPAVSAIVPTPSSPSTSEEGIAVDGDVEPATAGAPERRRFKEVWLVEDRREGKSMWTRVGTAFENADGSWNIRLSALPVAGGRLNMRDPLVRTEEERQERHNARARKVAA